VPNVEVVSLDCGHWIQQEKPEETTETILKWLDQRDHLIDVCRLTLAHHGRRRALKDSGGAHAACGLGIEKEIDV
jgi:hypothetical protein